MGALELQETGWRLTNVQLIVVLTVRRRIVDVVPLELKKGDVYLRSDLHNAFGGQWDYGISTPAKSPIILLFSTPTRDRYGYQDGWSGSLYSYSGQGQTGDMTFTRGNDAVRRHAELGKELHLFVFVRTGHFRYEGQFEYVGHETIRNNDREGNPRNAIVFKLRGI
jgi:5-methylcytosine-specific restriction protein A